MNLERFTRSNDDKMIAGVAAGLANAFNVDPVLTRLAFVLLMLAGGPGIIIYLILALVMPKSTDDITFMDDTDGVKAA